MRCKVVNVVATAHAGQNIDLETLGNLPGVLYDVNIYRCAYLKNARTNGKVSIFRSGRMISIGTTTEQQAIHDLRYATRFMVKNKLIKPVKVKVKISNIVATMNIGAPVDLTDLAEKIPSIIYEPEQFPGAVYRPDKSSSITALIFASGKIVLTGLNSLDSLNTVSQEIAKQTIKHRVNQM